MNASIQVQIPAAKGLNTWAARGSQDAPHTLLNATLRPGGWACARRARARMAGVVAGLYAGQRSDLFVETPDGVGLYDGESYVPLPGGTGATLTGAVALAPGLAMLADGRYLLADGGVGAMANAATITEWDGVGTPPADPHWQRVGDAEYYSAYFRYAESYTLWIVPIRDLDNLTPYNGVTVLTIPSIPKPPTATSDSYRLILRGIDFAADIYHDGYQPHHTRPAVRFVMAYTPSPTLPDFQVAGPSGKARYTSIGGVRPVVSEYHQGRIWAAGQVGFLPMPVTSPTVTYETQHPSRLYYTEVIASTGQGALPFWAEDFYFDVPFRVSSRIVALQSAGRYLYIFGDREVLILSGYDDASWTVESVGDSIGAIVASSVQRLQNAAFYLSDSGVMALQGGQAQDISGDVRDLVLGLNRETLTSTVDFEQEQYLLSDGTNTLVYHLREQGWTMRGVDGADQRLIYGGGVPYSVHAGALHSLDSEKLLPMTVTLGPFGHPGTRRTWRGVVAAVDTDGAADLQLSIRGHDVNFDLDVVAVEGAAQTRTAVAGLTPVAVSVGDAASVLITATLVELTLTLTPDEDTTRAILRPPLELLGHVATEVWG